MTISNEVAHAIRAAQKWQQWGRFAATRYLQRRGVDLRLWYLCRRLEAVKGLPVVGRFAI